MSVPANQNEDPPRLIRMMAALSEDHPDDPNWPTHRRDTAKALFGQNLRLPPDDRCREQDLLTAYPGGGGAYWEAWLTRPQPRQIFAALLAVHLVHQHYEAPRHAIQLIDQCWLTGPATMEYCKRWRDETAAALARAAAEQPKTIGAPIPGEIHPRAALKWLWEHHPNMVPVGIPADASPALPEADNTAAIVAELEQAEPPADVAEAAPISRVDMDAVAAGYWQHHPSDTADDLWRQCAADHPTWTIPRKVFRDSNPRKRTKT